MYCYAASRGLGEGVLSAGCGGKCWGMVHLVVCFVLSVFLWALVQSATKMFWVVAGVPSSGLSHCGG